MKDDAPEALAKIETIQGYVSTDGIPASSLLKMAKLSAVIDQWMRDTEVAISAIQCWTSMEEYFGVVPCTVMSMMSNNLMSSACEVDIAGSVGKLNTFGTCVGRVKSGAMTYARFSTDDFSGRIRGYVGEGEFTDDPLHTFGGAGVVKIDRMQQLLAYICEEGFEHHVAANFSTCASAVHEAATKYLGWDVHHHR
jgi:L-fucose isomerase-like protein